MTASVPDALGPGRSMHRRVVGLAWFTVIWNVLEAVVAIGEGAAASSSALIGFGLDSSIEVSSALIVLWQFRASLPESRERSALRLIAVSFFALALWLTVTAGTDLVGRHEPEVSGLGIVLALASLVVMPVLAAEKRRVGTRMGAATVVADSAQTWLCTALSAVLLLGLGANAAFGWWWADPLAALVIAVVAAREGVEAWRGENCCAPTVDVESCCVAGGCG